MVHSDMTEIKHLKTWVPEYPLCQLTTSGFTCPYSKRLGMVGNITKSEKQTVTINKEHSVTSESVSASTPSMQSDSGNYQLLSLIHRLSCVSRQTCLPATAVYSSTNHYDQTICYHTSKDKIYVTFGHLEVMHLNKCIKIQPLAEGQSPYGHISFFLRLLRESKKPHTDYWLTLPKMHSTSSIYT